MARILFFVAMLALTIYAAADWHRTPEDEMPGKLPKPIWLLIILFTATIPSAPDDDPEFLFRLGRDIQRKRREEERRKRERGEDASDGDATGADS